MAILQALLVLLGKSAGKILNAIFGWAVRALFGQSTARQQTFLSALVGAAVAWPLLLVGLAFPRVAAMLLAFVPIPHFIPSWSIRLVWLALAVIVPLALGLALGAKAPPGTASEPFVKRMLRGFPITIGLTAAFLIMFVSVPVMRLAALVRKQRSASIPAVTTTAAYHQMSALTVDVLKRAGFALQPARPGWWVLAPTRILSWLGGNAFAAFVPATMAHFESPTLKVSFYPSGVLLRGQPQPTTWAQGLLTEALMWTDALQSSDPKAQELEKRIRAIWRSIPGGIHRHAAHAGDNLTEIASELGKLEVEFDDWQILYRQALQLGRAIRGERQLLEQRAQAEAGPEAPSGVRPADDERDPGGDFAEGDGHDTSVDLRYGQHRI